MESSRVMKNNRKFEPRAFLYPTLIVAAIGTGLLAGFEVAQMLKPDTYQFEAGTANYKPDVTAIMAKVDKASKSGTPYGTALAPEEMTVAAFTLFAEKENSWSQGVGYTQAAMVKQVIQTTTVRDKDRYFEESISSGLVNIHDRMFRQGDTTKTYWGEKDDYASHPEKSMSNTEYAELMGRNVADPLVYLVSPATLLSGASKSGDKETGIYQSGEQYVVELELDPKTAILQYQCQMQAISSLKYKPTFDYCHLTVTLDKNLTLQKMVSHEKYFATTSAGIGSSCEGRLVTVYHHESPSFGFPEVGSKIADYPESLE